MPPRPFVALLIAVSAVATSGFTRKLALPGGGEWHRSPIAIGKQRTAVFNAEAGNGRYAIVFGPSLEACWGEGVRYDPPVAPGKATGDLAKLRRFERHAVAVPPVRLHLSFGSEGGEARAWVWTTTRAGARVRFVGRAPQAHFLDLVEYAYGHEFRPEAPPTARALYFK